jgi:hypothetical protein
MIRAWLRSLGERISRWFIADEETSERLSAVDVEIRIREGRMP